MHYYAAEHYTFIIQIDPIEVSRLQSGDVSIMHVDSKNFVEGVPPIIMMYNHGHVSLLISTLVIMQ